MILIATGSASLFGIVLYLMVTYTLFSYFIMGLCVLFLAYEIFRRLEFRSNKRDTE